MAILGAFDVHRRQVTFDYVDTETGQVRTGRVEPACRESLRRWLGHRFAGGSDATFVVEGCTGWRFVTEELAGAGLGAVLAEPAETANLRGNKRQAKTDKIDARHGRQLLEQGRVPRSWIPPFQVLEMRALLQLYGDLSEERYAWVQRIHATLFHQGVPALAGRLDDQQVRARLRADPDGVGLSPVGAVAVAVALDRIDELEAARDPVYAEIARFADRQPGCRALRDLLFGVGPLTAAALWAYLGDTRRFSSSSQAVRHTGLDITVYSSDGKRLSHGRLAKQGEPLLRWLLFEAGHQSARSTAPDHEYYTDVAARIDAQRAALSVARKIVRRAHHILRGLGDDVLAVIDNWRPSPAPH